MPITLDPDAAAVYKAFQEAGRPPYETVPPATRANSIWQAASSAIPSRPNLNRKTAVDPGAARRDPGPHLHAEDIAQERRGWPHAWCSSMAAAG